MLSQTAGWLAGCQSWQTGKSCNTFELSLSRVASCCMHSLEQSQDPTITFQEPKAFFKTSLVVFSRKLRQKGKGANFIALI